MSNNAHSEERVSCDSCTLQRLVILRFVCMVVHSVCAANMKYGVTLLLTLRNRGRAQERQAGAAATAAAVTVAVATVAVAVLWAKCAVTAAGLQQGQWQVTHSTAVVSTTTLAKWSHSSAAAVSTLLLLLQVLLQHDYCWRWCYCCSYHSCSRSTTVRHWHCHMEHYTSTTSTHQTHVSRTCNYLKC
jgi:hypothetical protein